MFSRKSLRSHLLKKLHFRNQLFEQKSQHFGTKMMFVENQTFCVHSKHKSSNGFPCSLKNINKYM